MAQIARLSMPIEITTLYRDQWLRLVATLVKPYKKEESFWKSYSTVICIC